MLTPSFTGHLAAQLRERAYLNRYYYSQAREYDFRATCSWAPANERAVMALVSAMYILIAR